MGFLLFDVYFVGRDWREVGLTIGKARTSLFEALDFLKRGKVCELQVSVLIVDMVQSRDQARELGGAEDVRLDV